jgi:hypothetical protein
MRIAESAVTITAVGRQFEEIFTIQNVNATSHSTNTAEAKSGKKSPQC